LVGRTAELVQPRKPKPLQINHLFTKQKQKQNLIYPRLVTTYIMRGLKNPRNLTIIPKQTMEYNKRITQITIVPKGESILSELATEISIDDEGAGEFIVVNQPLRDESGIQIDPEEWEIVKSTIDKMIADIQLNQK
jgi:hypothetical protein